MSSIGIAKHSCFSIAAQSLCYSCATRESIENKIALRRSDGPKSNFSNNFTVLRFLVNRVAGKRIWPAQDDDDDKPTLKLETVSCPRVKIGIIGLLHFLAHTSSLSFRYKVPTHGKTKSEFHIPLKHYDNAPPTNNKKKNPIIQ